MSDLLNLPSFVYQGKDLDNLSKLNKLKIVFIGIFLFTYLNIPLNLYFVFFVI